MGGSDGLVLLGLASAWDIERLRPIPAEHLYLSPSWDNKSDFFGQSNVG